MSEPVSRHFLSHRLRLHYVDWGNERAPPLILLHGGSDHARSWDDVARSLKNDFHVIAPDLRGHGDSDWAADGCYSISAHVTDLAELVRSEGLAPVSIIAHSYGARISLRYAGIFPEGVRRLISIEGLFEVQRRATSTHIREFYERQHQLTTKAPPHYASVEEAADRMRMANPRLSAELALRLAHHGTRPGQDGLYRWKFDILTRPRTPAELNPEEETAIFAGIECPTLLVQGREGRAATEEQHLARSAIRNARSITFEGAGHWVQHDRLEAFVKTAKEFLAFDE